MEVKRSVVFGSRLPRHGLQPRCVNMMKHKINSVIEAIILVTAWLCMSFTFANVNLEGGIHGITSLRLLLLSLIIGLFVLIGIIVASSIIYGVLCGNPFLDVNLPRNTTTLICIALIITCLFLFLLPEVLRYLGHRGGIGI